MQNSTIPMQLPRLNATHHLSFCLRSATRPYAPDRLLPSSLYRWDSPRYTTASHATWRTASTRPSEIAPALKERTLDRWRIAYLWQAVSDCIGQCWTGPNGQCAEEKVVVKSQKCLPRVSWMPSTDGLIVRSASVDSNRYRLNCFRRPYKSIGRCGVKSVTRVVPIFIEF